jgi:hypothetical protein
VGQGSIALGNVVGSNIFNIAVILGLSALVRPRQGEHAVDPVRPAGDDRGQRAGLSCLLRDASVEPTRGARCYSRGWPAVYTITVLVIRLARRETSIRRR